MNAHLQKLTEALSEADSADLLKSRTVHSSGRAAQIRGGAGPIPSTQHDERHHATRLSGDKDRAAVERCVRVGEVMDLLFPDGIRLTNGREFATYRLLDALVGTLAQFAHSGMAQETALTAISRYATLLEHMVEPRDASELLDNPLSQPASKATNEHNVLAYSAV
jgi:hypothetical protein